MFDVLSESVKWWGLRSEAPNGAFVLLWIGMVGGWAMLFAHCWYIVRETKKLNRHNARKRAEIARLKAERDPSYELTGCRWCDYGETDCSCEECKQARDRDCVA